MDTAHKRNPRPDYIDAEPVRAWLKTLRFPNGDVYPQEHLAALIAERTGTAFHRWRRWFERLPKARVVSVFAVDEICCAFGKHISAFDPAYCDSRTR